VKLKTESLNLNLLQEQAAELEKEKNIMIIEVEALHTDFNGRLALLDSEINTVSLTRVFILFDSRSKCISFGFSCLFAYRYETRSRNTSPAALKGFSSKTRTMFARLNRSPGGF